MLDNRALNTELLYKYRCYNAYSLANLANETVWLSKPKSFNDPFDCAITLDRDTYKQSMIDAIIVAMERTQQKNSREKELFKERPGDRDAFEALRDGVKDLFQNIGICSFSAVPDHILMWSHYADHHKGFCVEYDCREGTKLKELAQPVTYSESFPKVSASDLVGDRQSEVIDYLWLTKSSVWSYEQEWRVMMPEGDKGYQSPSKITTVIFGAKMPIDDRVTVRNILNDEVDVVYKEAILADGHFKLEIKDFGWS